VSVVFLKYINNLLRIRILFLLLFVHYLLKMLFNSCLATSWAKAVLALT